MTKLCPNCKVENAREGKFCIQCGADLALVEAEEPYDRFKTLVAVFIAIVSIVGAVLAWRISVASSSAADADVSGVVSTIEQNQALVASEADMYRNQETYLQVRIHDRLSEDLLVEYERYPSSSPTRDHLWAEAWTEIFVAEAYLDQVNIRPEYIRTDGSYDGRAAQDVDLAHRALNSDFAADRRFDQADLLRGKAQWLMGLAPVLSVALLFYTLAEVITTRLRYVCFALGSLILLVVLAGLPLIEFAAF
jgi:hypothetical protein